MPRERQSKLSDTVRTGLRSVTTVPAVVMLVVLEGIVAALDLDAGSNRWHLVIVLSPLPRRGVAGMGAGADAAPL